MPRESTKLTLYMHTVQCKMMVRRKALQRGKSISQIVLEYFAALPDLKKKT